MGKGSSPTPRDDADLLAQEIVRPILHSLKKIEFHGDGVFDAYIADDVEDRDILSVEVGHEIVVSINARSYKGYDNPECTFSSADPDCIKKAQDLLKEWLE